MSAVSLHRRRRPSGLHVLACFTRMPGGVEELGVVLALAFGGSGACTGTPQQTRHNALGARIAKHLSLPHST